MNNNLFSLPRERGIGLLVGVVLAAAYPPLHAQPAVSVSNPSADAAYSTGNTVLLTANATPSSGATISGIQYFNGSTLIGQSGTQPFSFTWTNLTAGAYSIQAIATDSLGLNAESNAVSVSVADIDLPYITDFEASEGYALGSLNGQLGWSVLQGDAEVVAGQAYLGSQSVTLEPASPPSFIEQAIQSPSNPSVVYVDFFFQPVADPNVACSSTVTAGGGTIGFLASGGTAVVEVFNGNGQGAGTWTSTTAGTALAVTAGTNQVSGWHRFTLREDFSNQIWDLYVDGTMVAYNLNFPSSMSALGSFALMGVVSFPAGLDSIYLGTTNPLFTNESNDGIADAWKLQYGLDPTQNDRSLAPSGNGTTIIQEYVSGTNPLDYYSGRAEQISFPAASSQVSYTYDASGRLVTVQVGNLSTESYGFDNATNLTSATISAQPIVTWRSTNNLPPDGSGIGMDSASPAGDNLPNLAKYALGLPPLLPASGPVPIIGLETTGGSAYLTLQYSRPDPAPADITYTVQVSADAQNWSSGSGATMQLSSATANGVATLVYADLTAIGQPQYGRYIRLLITRVPVPQ